MNVNGINGNNAGIQPMNLNQGADAVSRELLGQIANIRKELQEMSRDQEMSQEEKMKKRQELQREENELQNQLRRHQADLRREKQAEKDQSAANSSAVKNSSAGKDSSAAFAIISADSSLNQAKIQGAVKTRMEDRTNVLRSELEQDAGRGNTEKKKEELADMEAKTQDITASQMSTLSDIKKELETAKEDPENTDANRTAKPETVEPESGSRGFF